jgi:hypothetical protein
MKGNKIIATLVVLTMVLSTLVVLVMNQPNAVAVTPGFDEYGYATTDLVYGTVYSSVHINTSTWTMTNGTKYYLYYPTYLNTGAGPNANAFSWNGPFKVGVNAYVDTKAKSELMEPSGTDITFNRSGIWIFDDDTDHTTYAGYIWVNTSTVYTIQSVSDFNYDSSGSLTVTVNTGSDTGCMIDIIGPDNSTVYHKWRATGITNAIGIEEANFSMAGDYTVKAYRDFDLQDDIYLYADEGGASYSSTYGSTITATGYTYATIGPWDPPEKNATEITFTVSTGKPIITLTNTSLYWGYKAEIDINVTDADGVGLDITPNPIILKYGSKYVPFSGYITNLGDGNYTIQIPRFNEGIGWADLATGVGTGNVNGTWKVVFGYDVNGDGTYEWNNSASFSVKSSSPPVQLIIANDGYADSTDKKVEVPAYTPGSGSASTIDIVFDIFGTSITDNFGRAYYGDNPLVENSDNITVEGDILYPADAVYSLDVSNPGRWTATVTPTKPSGTITITIDWPGDDNGTASQTIEIVNGTYVTSAVPSFTIGASYNLTVTVKDMDDSPVKNGYVYLMWEDIPVQFNATIGDNTVGNGKNGEYTFWIRPQDATTPDWAPQNITVAAQWYSHFWGYTKVVMERDHDMMVNITPTTAYAGDAVEYDITVSLVGGGHPDATGLSIALFNETGKYVTGIDEWYKDGDYDITNEEIILSGGTYYIAAMNDTSDSQGHNATLIVTNYIVTSSPSILAWIIDEDTNMTFQLTPAGDGTLTLYNMSSTPAASDLGASTAVSIENGSGTLNGVDATTLGNVTFSYTPDGGADRMADGLLRVTTATATPNPATIYLGEATVVTITVTHPATGVALKDVRIGLDHGMPLNESILAKLPTDLFTDANGRVEFSISADASGNVTIYIENETDPDNAFVIFAQARKPMTISLNPSVDEGKTFTVEAKSNGVLITDTPVTFTFDGQTWPTTTGVATLTAPSVPTSLTYPITATAEGYATAIGAMIMVINIPKLIVAIAGEVKTGQTFTMTIADDTGSPVIGATITFDGKTYTSGAGGVITITAPSTEGTYPVTATFPGYATLSDTVTVVKGGGIPGFELLTLIAAIGVAFLLLRRRRN